MATITLDEQAMNDAASRLVTGKDDIQLKLDEMRAFIHELVVAGFNTPIGSPKFTQTFDDFTAGMSNSITALDSMATFLRQTASGHFGLDSGQS